VKKRSSGIALFLTLMITSILVMMVTATLFTARGGSVFSHDYHAKRAAYYAAESGLSILQQRLKDDPSYRTVSVKEKTPFGNGAFTIRFGPGECVSNMDGSSPIAGPYGEIPAGSCYVRIIGEALGHQEVVECMLGRKDSDSVAAAVVASGKVFLDGNISVTGRDSNDLLSQTAADIISNYDKPTWSGKRPLEYIREPGETAKIEGAIRSSSPSPAAISTDLKAASSAALTDQSPVPTKNINISAIVDSKSSNPSPPGTGIPLTGSYYRSGDYVVPGDVVLNDAELYVDGDLTVIGSITGVGSVYVKGNTVFSGDAFVSSSDDGIALYSEGNVSLTGFDGSAYMDALTSRPGLEQRSRQWEQTKEDFGLLADYMRDPARYRVNSTDPNDYWGSDIGRIMNYMSNTAATWTMHPARGTGSERNNLWELGNLIEAQSSSPAQEFMLKKFKALRRGHEGKASSAPAHNLDGAMGITYSSTNAVEVQKVRDFLDRDIIGNALFNKLVWIKTSRLEGDTLQYSALSDADIDLAVVKMTNWMENFEYNKLGSSFFQGAIYTRGAFYAANQVTIVGSVAVVEDPETSASKPDFNPVTGVSLRPGDLYLGNGTNITFVSDIAPGSGDGEPMVGVSYWLR